jgi:C4-dicarboxylate-specific signal transduction histidine kinase
MLDSDPKNPKGTTPGTSLQAMETRRKHKSSRVLHVLVSRSKVKAQSSRLGFVEVSLDMSARRELEQELEHSSRLATIGRLSASMSHEINNPLAVIRSSSAWLRGLAEGRGDEELIEAAVDMEIAADRIGGFVDHVCGFARRGRPVVSESPLSTTLEMAVRMVRPRATTKRVSLVIEPSSAGERAVLQDAPRLAQACINLIANAIDAAAQTAAETGGGQVRVSVVESPDRVSIRVEDNGPGVAVEIRDELFEPFSTTKPFGEGTGLGLALTRQIVEDHHGSVELKAREAGGTCAELSIPVGQKLAPVSERMS